MKYKLITFGLVFIFIVSWITMSLGIDYTSDQSRLYVPSISDGDFDYNFITGVFKTFWALVTFNVIGMPYVISIIFLIISMLLFFVLTTDVLIPILSANHWVLLGIGVLSLLAGLIALLLSLFDWILGNDFGGLFGDMGITNIPQSIFKWFKDDVFGKLRGFGEWLQFWK